MNKIAEKLTVLADEAQSIASPLFADQWSSRVRGFVSAAIGPEEATAFNSLWSGEWDSTLALRRGHLEGLAAKLETDTQAQDGSTRPKAPVDQKPPNSQKVFIVHGHDDAAKESVARFMERIGLKPIVLHEQPSSGRTIIEKFETYSDDVAFAVVLLTPDDVGYEARNSSNSTPRARQNVIMELGFFIGRLGRTRVCALVKGQVERPSDYQGVVYVEMDSSGAWKAKLAQELVQSKILINVDGLLGG